MTITPAFFILLLCLQLYLSIRVIRKRRGHKIAIGDGGHPELQRAASAAANFSEYVPMTLLGLLLAELMRAPDWRIYLAGGLLLFGRLIHAYGISQRNENFRFRIAGMLCTFTAMASLIVTILIELTVSGGLSRF